jgi:hypothetical protein
MSSARTQVAIARTQRANARTKVLFARTKVAFGGTSPPSARHNRQIHASLKSPFTLSFAGDQVGQQFYAAARWATRTGLVGPWSQIISITVIG